MSRLFPEGFIWGAASSAYQTEGSPTAGGGGESIWDSFCRRPGAIARGEDGSLACDGYHRYGEDIELLSRLGAGAYRFSTSWARIDPQGRGQFNAQGLDYYDRVVDLCLEKGLRPFMTLYHWELPQALQDRGGWQNRDTALAFGDFAARMAGHFKGRVGDYFTLNEPQCSLRLGLELGVHAPGLTLDGPELFGAWRNLLLAHGLAMRAIKARDGSAQVGLASTGRLCYPLTESGEDIEAACQASFPRDGRDWSFTHHWLLDPICTGTFPTAAPGSWLEGEAERVPPEELEQICCPPDMVGLNIYNGDQVRSGPQGAEAVERCPGFPRTSLGWTVSPEVMDWGPRFIWQRYGLPCYITENGVSCNDRIYLDGKVHDGERIDFLRRYLAALARAMEAGADIRGYFHWSLTDNFEWHSGYSQRFGLIYIDYPSQKRTPKDSYHWYGRLISTGSL